jgi:hypothetical protein
MKIALYILTYTHSLQPTILNDNVNQFKIGLELDKAYFTLKVKTMGHMRKPLANAFTCISER